MCYFLTLKMLPLARYFFLPICQKLEILFKILISKIDNWLQSLKGGVWSPTRWNWKLDFTTGQRAQRSPQRIMDKVSLFDKTSLWIAFKVDALKIV